MDTEFTPFMRDLENRFKLATQLEARSHYKIFYGQIRQAPILILGINPGGDPENTSADGVSVSSGDKASASASYFEGDEHDVLDCDWKENRGIMKLLNPLLRCDHERIRREVVKTNLAFRRSKTVKALKVGDAIKESAPFLQEIMGVVRPELVLLTGSGLKHFSNHFASQMMNIERPEKHPRIGHTVFAAAKLTLKSPTHEVLAVQVAHASQFSWTYERFCVVERLQTLLDAARRGTLEPLSLALSRPTAACRAVVGR